MKIYLSLVLLLFIFTQAAEAQTIRYVKTNSQGIGNGSSWENASSDLQAMIDLSEADDQIWVAAGTYKPNSYPSSTSCTGCSNSLDFAFLLKNGVEIYGGFEGAETNFSLRNPKQNLTTLSGDLNDDGTVKTYHVVLSIGDSEATVLDGFTISGSGKNDVSSAITVKSGSVPRDYGGGVFVLNSSPAINYCTFSNNLSKFGGAAALDNSTTLFNNCIFYKNSALVGGGFFIGNSSPKFANCVFSENTAANGGGMYVGSGDPGKNTFSIPSMVNCLMIKNSATSQGGAVHCSAGSQYPITATAGISANNCVFFNNSAQEAGMIYHGDTRSTAITTSNISNSIIWGNTSTRAGTEVANNLKTQGIYTICQGVNRLSGQANFYTDPLFSDVSDPDGPDNTWLTVDDGLQLSFCSPAIDAGATFGSLFTDILGNSVYNSIKDIGAYERQSPGCKVFTASQDCNSLTLPNVSQERWYRFFTTDGIIAELNPNGLDLGTVTILVNDIDGALNFDNTKFLGRSVTVTSSNYPTGTFMPANYKLRLFYANSEVTEYNNETSENNTPGNFNISWKEGGSGCDLASYLGKTNGLISKSSITNSKLGYGDSGFYLEFSLNHLTVFLSTTNNPLPVTLISFTGKNEGSYNLLRWQTSSEIDNNYFEIERSSNGHTFEKIGEKIRGAGSSNISNFYKFEDATYMQGINYYRLNQIDVDGKQNLSRIIAVENKTSEVLYPNPVKNDLFLNTSLINFKYQILDANGRVVKKGAARSKSPIPTDELPQGVYMINYQDRMFKFIKE